MMSVSKCGYSGGTGGQEFSDDALPDSSKVIQVKIRSGELLDAIQIVHETNNGIRHPMPLHGGNGGEQQDFLLDEDEFITGVTGRFGNGVDSIQFITNKQRSSVFGGSGGSATYTYEAPQGTEVVGFFGRSGATIDALGIVLRAKG
jgi:Jacalin-like lectin domain